MDADSRKILPQRPPGKKAVSFTEPAGGNEKIKRKKGAT
jgi:hypothetical protein